VLGQLVGADRAPSYRCADLNLDGIGGAPADWVEYNSLVSSPGADLNCQVALAHCAGAVYGPMAPVPVACSSLYAVMYEGVSEGFYSTISDYNHDDEIIGLSDAVQLTSHMAYTSATNPANGADWASKVQWCSNRWNPVPAASSVVSVEPAHGKVTRSELYNGAQGRKKVSSFVQVRVKASEDNRR
jgi:hypothetical protein